VTWRSKPDHELHRAGSGRNLGLGCCWWAFIAIVFGLTIVKVSAGGHDAGVRPCAAPRTGGEGREAMTPGRAPPRNWSGVVVLMGSLSFAAVPFYDWFCRVTGFGGTTMRGQRAPDTILDQTIACASTPRWMPTCPGISNRCSATMTLRIGESRAGLL
jgi:hypothetical protein